MVNALSCAAAILAGSQATNHARTSDFFPDVPANHWAYQALADAKNEGLLVGYPDLLGKRNQYGSIFETVVKFHAVKTNLSNLAESLKYESFVLAHQAAGTLGTETKRAILQDNIKAFSGPNESRVLNELGLALTRVASEFAPELKALGTSPDGFRTAMPTFQRFIAEFRVPEVGSALQQFQDVPADHWAAKAVLELRKAGILDGYPNNHFGG